MALDIRLVSVLPRRLAAVERQATLAEMPKHVPQALAAVWRFLAANKINSTGRNVAVYLDVLPTPDGDVYDCRFGVEVYEELPSSDEVSPFDTPDGPAVMATYHGPYDQLLRVHDEVRGWCKEHGYSVYGPSWEVYGPQTEDSAKLRTDVFFSVRFA